MFTIEDAENDGKLKREVSSELAKVAAQDGGQLYDFFMDVCDHEGRDPKEVLGSLALKAVRNEEFAQRLAEVEPDMSEVMAGQLRKEDARFVKEFSEELGLDQEDDTHWLRETVQEQVKKRTDSPVPRLGTEPGGGGSGSNDKEVAALRKEIAALRKEMADGGSVSEGQDVEDLFEDSDDNSTTVEVVDETTSVEEDDTGQDDGIPSSTEVDPDGE